ncbi:unnamed protein product [Fraxinus pennsylvanica]|uniref:MIR domain-containing protein n=1 Tax=Fraxinus pennsylvanica TaxID=56036 RepID=A0AAD1YQ19_9LAMI|nr:unnamed protein product [Fraxinus pennsylvanica]
MALCFFAFAIVLLLTLDSDSNSIPVSAASEGVQITYGSVIKLMHERSKFRLHSHDVPYGSGSGQQSVTGFPNVDDSNSYWIVRPTPDSSAKQGDPIKSGTIIRLQHMRTRKWLHSHLHASPISGNLEVSCFGGDGESDTGDYWRIDIEGSGKTWRQDQRVRLRHVDTGGYLLSHDKKYSRIAGGQQEVCGVREKRADNVWLAAEGVYLPVTESNILNERGRATTDPKEICTIFKHYYLHLFSSSYPFGIEEAIQDLEAKVTPGMKDQLYRSCTDEEVKRAVFEMDPLRSPGPDGFSADPIFLFPRFELKLGY